MIIEYQEIQCDCCYNKYKRSKANNNSSMDLYIIDDDDTGASYQFCSLDCMINYIKNNFVKGKDFKIYAYTVYVQKDEGNE